LRRGPQDAPRDIQVPLAPSGSRRLIPFAATVLRSLALLPIARAQARTMTLRRSRGYRGLFACASLSLAHRRTLKIQPGSSHAAADVKAPQVGYLAYLMEVEVTSPTGHPFKLSTEARVTPDNIR
jgi:hypothetical protein